MISSIVELNAASLLKYAYSPNLPVSNLPIYSGNILELHNDRPEQWFDFSFRINKDYDKQVLNAIKYHQNIPAFVSNGYEQLLDESSSSFQYGIENIWFEYDHPFPDTPSLFFDIHKNSGITETEKFSDVLKVCNHFKYHCNPKLPDFLNVLAENNLHVLYYGLMLPRQSSAMRMTVKGINADNLIDIIHKLGWRGDKSLLLNIMTTYIKSGQHLLLDVDYDTQLGDKIGIEIFDEEPLELLDKFIRHGVYQKPYDDFLRNWEETQTLPGEVTVALSGMYRRDINRLYKRINHFKITLENNIAKTKAYLYYCF